VIAAAKSKGAYAAILGYALSDSSNGCRSSQKEKPWTMPSEGRELCIQLWIHLGKDHADRGASISWISRLARAMDGYALENALENEPYLLE